MFDMHYLSGEACDGQLVKQQGPLKANLKSMIHSEIQMQHSLIPEIQSRYINKFLHPIEIVKSRIARKREFHRYCVVPASVF